MLLVPLQSIPNQEFTIVLDNNTYDIVVRYTNGATSVTITCNGTLIIENMQTVAGALIIPYQYLENSGNFIFVTSNQELPLYSEFGITQFLYYLNASDLATLRTPAPAIIPASWFNSLGQLPLRFAPQGYV